MSTLLNTLVCAPFQQGQKKSGVEHGCEFLDDIITVHLNIEKKFNVEPNITKIDTNQNPESWKQDYHKLYQTLCATETPYILVGGDHSIGMSSVACSIQKTSDVNNLYVIWIDAHADTNTMEASITKNIHGQPLAGIMGYEKPWFPIKCNLPFTNLLYFGIRDIDEFEMQKISENNIFHTRSLCRMLNRIKAIKKNNVNAVFHVSFDVDALDSSIMKSTGCVVDNGLFPHEVSAIINNIGDKLIALDVVEFNPKLGTMLEVDASYNSINEILSHVGNHQKEIKRDYYLRFGYDCC